MEKFLEKTLLQTHPLRVLEDFLIAERSAEQARRYDEQRFVGYVLEISYDSVTMITSDPYKELVGGIPRNSLLIMVPAEMPEGMPSHFILLRVSDSAPTPLSSEIQQTYFELQKKSMPELDVFTQSELQWGALNTAVLGMYYPSPDDQNAIEFSGDMNNFVSAHKYRVYAPNNKLLDLVINSLVPKDRSFSIGNLRLTESRLALPTSPLPEVSVRMWTRDFLGTRTALFGKTRLGKSNIVKLIAQSIIETTDDNGTAGQLIFDVDGEYANDNPQDESKSIASVNPKRCKVFALTKKANTESTPLRLNFYEYPNDGHKILGSLVRERGRDTSDYIRSFLTASVPGIEDLKELGHSEKLRARRKILMYWAILHRAGYQADQWQLSQRVAMDPQFSGGVLDALYGDRRRSPRVDSLEALSAQLELAADADRGGQTLQSTSGGALFDTDDRALLGFLKPAASTASGPNIITPFRQFHDKTAGDFVSDIIDSLDQGKTAILDLSNAPPEVMNYFSDHLSRTVFAHQVEKFANNNLGDHFVQIYFEEAHNLFPSRDEDAQDIYLRLAKEGAKYQIGMVYSTQSPSTISKDLLAQTENFFVVHLSSVDEANALARVNVAYESVKDDLLRTKTVGYVRMLTRSHRFVVPVQAKRFSPTPDPSLDRSG